MQKNKRFNIDFNSARSRYSQRTNEATLIVGRKTGDDSTLTDTTNTDTTGDPQNKPEDTPRNSNKLLLNFGKRRGTVTDNPENTANSGKNSSTGTKYTKNGSEPSPNSSTSDYKPVTLTVKFHETRTSTDTVLVDPNLVPGAKVGDVGEIQCLSGSKRKFFFKFKEFKDTTSATSNSSKTSPTEHETVAGHHDSSNQNNTGSTTSNSMFNTLDSKNALEAYSPSTMDLNTSHINSDTINNVISILSGPIVETLELKPRSQVIVRVKNKESVQADTVEIYVKDIHLSRGDMWNISGLLSDQCVYKNEKLSFIDGSIRLSVNKIYKNGRKYFSSFVGRNTKIVFRSDSARLIVFIQISLEMWNFEESGQQMFHKLMNSFFPKAFQKWKDLGTHHLITIILFSSVDAKGEKIRYAEGETPPNKTDYYRVVVDQVHILLWNEIMATLRLEFANFKRDIYLHKNKHVDTEHPQEYLIQTGILPSAKGSVLEAINLGMSLVCDDFKDSFLRQTTNHFIMISPGTGLFDVSYDMLIRTSKLISTVDSTVDIICLSQPPLHIVPLVRYLDNNNRLKQCIPNWLDISFWSDSSQAVHQWLPKCKIYDLQMMGVMENELSAVTINDLDLSNYRSTIEAMRCYDDGVFSNASSKKEKKYTNKSKKLYKSIHHEGGGSSSGGLKYKTVAINTNKNEITVGAIEEGITPADLILPNNTTSAATSTAVGVSTTSKSNVSALSSLLSISKSTNLNTPTLGTLNKFVNRIINTPIIKPSLDSDSKSADSSNSSMQSVDPLSLNSSSNGDADHETKLKNTPDSARSSITSIGMVKSDSAVGGKLAKNSTLSKNKKYPRTKPKSSKKRLKKNNSSEDCETLSNNYWTDIDNPSNALATKILSMLSYGRWAYVFPPNVKRGSVKWTSLSSPASLPVFGSIFPTLSDFNQNYTFQIYHVLLNQDIINENQTSETLMRSMISLRITLGFQICIGEKVEKVEKHRKPNGDPKMLVRFLNSGNFDGARVYLSLGNEIHRLCCELNGLINVQVYKRSTSNDEQLTLSNEKQYIEYIRTRYAESYSPVTINNSIKENARNYNWNKLDQVLAGYEESIDKQKHHRMKFVILPSTVSENAFSLTNEKLSTEEVRLEGIRSLIMNIYKIRFRTNEEKKVNKRLEISPEIYFYTGNLFEYLKNESDNIKKLKENNSVIPDSILTPSTRNRFSKSLQFDKSIERHKLVAILQSSEGIPVVDRHWHLKFYKNTFLGMDLVNFLVEHFVDIETREDAVEFGNLLMSEKIFSHAVAKHKFLDGYYFYYLDKKFTEDNKTINAGRILRNRSNSVHTSMNPELESNSNSEWDVNNNNEVDKEDIAKPTEKVTLSKSVLCDLDPNGYSWEPELIQVHYDIVHNPDHCFHLRIEWLNTTSKLVEDLINGWSKFCERYGLSLVEVPWEELFTLPIRNPLHSTIEITLALNPWEDNEFKKYTKIFQKEKYFFHLFLLHESSFMLDNRTANYFKNDGFEVSYSWGKPMFEFAQFIHSTGGYIAELRNNGDFFLAPNNAHISRLNLNIGKLHNLGKSKAIYFDSQSVMLEFRSICTDEQKLRELFRKGVKHFETAAGDFV